MDAERLARSRAILDRRFADIGPADRFARPARGWIKAIRSALGMTSAQLANRLGVKQPTVVAIERSEEHGNIRLSTLRRAAEAMNCTLVYALVPNEPLEITIRERARRIARRRLQSVEHSMLLENQNVPTADVEARIDAYARDIDPRRLWDEP